MRPENGGRAERLVHDAVALRQLQQLRDLLGGRSGIQLESEPDLTKADRRFLGDAERPAEVQIAFGGDGAAPDRDRQARRDRPQRDAGASDQCFEEHVARARKASVTTRRRMETGGDQGPPRFHFARDGFRAKAPSRAERDQRRARLLAIASLERRLEGTQLVSIHVFFRPLFLGGTLLLAVSSRYGPGTAGSRVPGPRR